jgi:aspartyl-tRNA(Asn)/glutamyl-tRNA(Gln) amidotransferase subunit C
MAITKEEVLYVANLARLRLDEEETERLARDMSQILDYMELLGQVDTSDVEPLDHVIEIEQSLRKDEPVAPLSHEDALKNAPDADSDYFRVPRVIE